MTTESNWEVIDSDELAMLRIQEKRYQTLRMNPEGPWYFPRTITDSNGNPHMIMPMVGDTALDLAIDSYNNEYKEKA